MAQLRTERTVLGGVFDETESGYQHTGNVQSRGPDGLIEQPNINIKQLGGDRSLTYFLHEELGC